MPGNFIEKRVGKKAFSYSLVTVLVLSGIGLLPLLQIDSVDAIFYLASFLSLLIGVLHVALLERFLPVRNTEFVRALMITLLILLGSGIIAGIIYYFKNGSFSFLSSLLAFVVPFLGYQTYLFLMAIPPSKYKLWYYPVNEEMPDLDMVDLSQIEVVQFVFNKKHQDPVKTNFTSKAPLNMSLGQLFFIFINDYNEKNALNTIDWQKEQKAPFGWIFYRKGKWFKKNFYFDPDLSFRDNRIGPNEIIQAERIA